MERNELNLRSTKYCKNTQVVIMYYSPLREFELNFSVDACCISTKNKVIC